MKKDNDLINDSMLPDFPEKIKGGFGSRKMKLDIDSKEISNLVEEE